MINEQKDQLNALLCLEEGLEISQKNKLSGLNDFMTKKRSKRNKRKRYILHRLHDKWNYFKCWAYKHFNRLHIKSLPPTWQDRDVLIEHAMFQILTDFIEKEKPDDLIDWDATPECRAARDKMQELYEWWHTVYLKFDSIDGFEDTKASKNRFSGGKLQFNKYERKFFDEANRKEDEMRKQLTIKMKELVDLRGYLWT